MRRYSRLVATEEKRNFRSAVLFGFLTIAFIVALFFIGIPVLGRFVGFVSDLGKSNKPITTTDKTPPAPPTFDTFSPFTNQKTITLTGRTEAGATVILTFDGNAQNVVADKNGQFTFPNLNLNDGGNDFSATATDAAGNVSQKTNTLSITFDNKSPNLTIDSPSDGSSFFGSKQRQVTIQGTTDAGDTVTVNDRIVVVDDNGKFQFTTSLNDGANTFAVKSTDQAGNTTEKDITLNFTS